jgi:hypothetical protein
MNQHSGLLRQDLRDNSMYTDITKGKLDLMVLRHMARRLHLTLHQLEEPTSPQPLLYKLQERHGRTHRIVIYRYQELLLKRSLNFVGFISGRQKHVHASIVDAIQTADRRLVQELVDIPGILSYSSLELRNGDWCNLVLLSDSNAKRHLKNTETHAYAAYELANHYYEWIRLHNGIMPYGLDHTEMILQKTRRYSFQLAQPRPDVRELSYGVC